MWKFIENEDVSKIAEAYALDAIDIAKHNFNVELDGSEKSVQIVEEILETLHNSLEIQKPSQEQIMMMSKIFGSYIGEVYRHHHGAMWGMMECEGQSFPSLRCAFSTVCFWPWGRVENRIIEGDENNVWHYYQTFVREKS